MQNKDAQHCQLNNLHQNCNFLCFFSNFNYRSTDGLKKSSYKRNIIHFYIDKTIVYAYIQLQILRLFRNKPRHAIKRPLTMKKNSDSDFFFSQHNNLPSLEFGLSKFLNSFTRRGFYLRT